MNLFKIIDARIRTTKIPQNVWDGNKFKKKTHVSYKPQVQIKFLWFTWWKDACCIECLSHTFAMNQLINCIKDYNKNGMDVTEIDYEYIEF